MHPFLRFFPATALVVVLGLLTPLMAQAQGRDPVAATELFSQGREMLRNGDLDKACSLFEESLRLNPAVGTALNLAECEERRGSLTAALHGWKQAIHLAEATNDERLEVARERHDALAPKVPRLSIVLDPHAPEGTTVSRQEIELGNASLGRSFPVDPGEHVIMVRSPGRQDTRVVVVLGEGDAKVVTVAAGELVPPPPVVVPVTVDTDSGDSRRTLAYVLGGVGLAGVVAATVSGVMLMDSRKRVKDHCDEENRCDQRGLDAADQGKVLVPVNTIAWVVGVAGLGAGTYFYFTPSGTSSSAAPIKPSGAYLQVGGSF